jgi:hypothetical protein
MQYGHCEGMAVLQCAYLFQADIAQRVRSQHYPGPGPIALKPVTTKGDRLLVGYSSQYILLILLLAACNSTGECKKKNYY